MNNRSVWGGLFGAIGILALQAQAEEPDWTQIGLGDLMNTKVESAARKQQAMSNTAAAVFVITAEDIRRSGALSIPEVLHMAPGVEVARVSNNKWAVSIRGFNGYMANKLLVLVDGRSIYSSLYGGVIWESENMPLQEIERIEVIRGAAGVAWGSNAVNGVINIITKRAQDTAGWLAEGHAGTSTGKSGEVLRYGRKLEDGAAFRVTLNNQKRDGGKELNGNNAQDQWNDSAFSFRLDMPGADGRRWMSTGKVYRFTSDQPELIPTFNAAAMYDPARYGATRLVPFTGTGNGANLLVRMDQVTEGGGEVRVRAYADQFRGTVPFMTDERTTVDLDAQHHFGIGAAHDIVWGGNYRQNKHKDTLTSLGFLYAPTQYSTVKVSSVFLQDEWTLVPKTFNIQAGIRYEKQTYGGTTPQPSLKAMWTPDEQDSVWAGWSRTVRSPSVVNELFGANPAAIPGGMPVLVRVAPGSQGNFGNEKVRTVELGYRRQWQPALSTDLVAFRSDYDGVYGMLPGATMSANAAGAAFTGLPYDAACAAVLTAYGLAGGPGLCQNTGHGNAGTVRTHGVEFASDWHVSADWRLQLSLTRLWLGGGAVQTNGALYGSSPNYQGSLRSSYDVSDSQRFDLWWRRIGGLAGHGSSGPATNMPIAARTELDLRYAIQASQALEVSLAGLNLLAKQQLQFYPDSMPMLPVVPQRTIYLQAVWRDN